MKNLVCLFIMIFFSVSCTSQVEFKSITTKELKVLLSKENIHYEYYNELAVDNLWINFQKQNDPVAISKSK